MHRFSLIGAVVMWSSWMPRNRRFGCLRLARRLGALLTWLRNPIFSINFRMVGNFPSIFELGPDDIYCLVINTKIRSYCKIGRDGSLSIARAPISLCQVPLAPCQRNAIPPPVTDENPE